MRFSFSAAGALLLALSHAESIITDPVQSVHIFYQPITQALSDTKNSLLASIKYDTSTLESRVLTYSPPAAIDTMNESQKSHPLVRIFTDSPHGSTTITSLPAFNPGFKQTLTLHLDNDNLVFAASFSADPLPPPSASDSSQPNLKVVLLRPTSGPTPKLHLRKPAVVDADGKEIPQAPEVEKSFFQKYWWALALVAVLALSGGGDK
jgi:hypothetical protein